MLNSVYAAEIILLTNFRMCLVSAEVDAGQMSEKRWKLPAGLPASRSQPCESKAVDDW